MTEMEKHDKNGEIFVVMMTIQWGYRFKEDLHNTLSSRPQP